MPAQPIARGAWAGDYRAADIKAALRPSEWERFCHWMHGQSMGLADDGTSIVYARDWERWQQHRHR